MKDALFQLKSYYFPNKKPIKENQLNLPSIISKKQELKIYEKIDKQEILKKQEDPLVVRIKKKSELNNNNYIEEYFNNMSLIKKFSIKSKNFLVKNKFISEKRLWSLKRTNSVFYQTPNFADHINKHYFFSKRITVFMIVLLSYTTGYLYSRCTHDVYFRRYGYSFFPTIMTYVDNIDYKLIKFDESLESYFPRDFSEKEYEYLIYNKIMYYYTRRRFDSKLKKIQFIDKDILEIDSMLLNMNS
jgi:hypothetical protein